MKFESKFNPGDTVFIIKENHTFKQEVCKRCDGAKFFLAPNVAPIRCYDCRGEGTVTNHKFPIIDYYISSLTVGKIDIEFVAQNNVDHNNYEAPVCFDNYGPQKQSYVEKYMCYETGIGSGSVYNVEKMFGTKEEAEKEIERLKNTLTNGM